MSGNVLPELDAAHRAALSANKPLVCECPPAWWFTQPIFEGLQANQDGALQLIAIVPQIEDHDDALRVIGSNQSLTPVHLASGLARTNMLLRQDAITSLVTTAQDLAALIKQSAINPQTVSRVVIAWPELYAAPAIKAMEECLAELSSAQRLVVTSNRSDVAELVERYARRAPVYRSCMPDAPSRTRLRYAIVPVARRETALHAALDTLNPQTATVWEPAGTPRSLPGLINDLGEDQRVDLAVFMDLPSQQTLESYAARADATLVFIRPTQQPYLQRLVVDPAVLKLPSAADRVRDRAAVLRAELRDTLTGGLPIGVLTTLEPLLEEFDPVEIAAAALTNVWKKRTDPEAATWTRIRADIGKRDGVRAGDLVGALANAVGIQPADVGRIDLRESFTIIEIRPEDASRAMQGLTGTAIRGKRLTARLDDVRRATSPKGGRYPQGHTPQKGDRPIRSRRPSGPDRA